MNSDESKIELANDFSIGIGSSVSINHPKLFWVRPRQPDSYHKFRISHWCELFARYRYLHPANKQTHTFDNSVTSCYSPSILPFDVIRQLARTHSNRLREIGPHKKMQTVVHCTTVEMRTFATSQKQFAANDSLDCGRSADFAYPCRRCRCHRNFRRANWHHQLFPHAKQRPKAHRQQPLHPFDDRYPAANENANDNWLSSTYHVSVRCTDKCTQHRFWRLVVSRPINIWTMCRWQSMRVNRQKKCTN